MSISIDFIVKFLKVDGMNTVIVIVDRFTKYTVFVVTPIVCTTKVAAKLFYQNMVKYFGVLFNNVVQYDRDKTRVFRSQSSANRWADIKDKCFAEGIFKTLSDNNATKLVGIAG